jgi:hypothetical protein
MLPLLPALALLAAFLLALQVVEGEQTSGIDGMLFGSGQEGQDTSASNGSKAQSAQSRQLGTVRQVLKMYPKHTRAAAVRLNSLSRRVC